MHYNDNSDPVPSVGFDYDSLDPLELQAAQRELYGDALRLQRERGFAEGEAAALDGVLDQLLSGRISAGAIVTRVAALAVRQKKMSPKVAQRITGIGERALRKAVSKVERAGAFTE